jgi:hypothetical protein
MARVFHVFGSKRGEFRPVDAAKKLPKRVILLLRARRAFLALCALLTLWLGLLFCGKNFGFSLPVYLPLVVAFGSALAFAWPISVRWYRVGKRLGLGGKLAGLSAALHEDNPTFVALLFPRITLRARRLFFPEIFALLPVFAFASLLFLPLEHPQPEPALVATDVFSASESSFSALPSPEGNERKPLQAQAIPELPSGFASTFSPYEEILAELLGVQVPPEEVGARLAQEEGLLRHLAEVLGEALTQGVNEEIQRELAEVVSEISRPDLRSALSSAVEGESDLEKAQALVSAALEGLERVEELASRQGSSAQVPEGSGSEGFALQGSPDSLAHKPTEILMDTEAEDRLFGRLEESEKGLGLGVGWEKGEPVQPGQPSPAPKPEEAVSVPVRVGEGPSQRSFALGLPGETPGTEPESTALPQPQELELTLRAKDLPPGLRDMVRRYFQILTEGEGS